MSEQEQQHDGSDFAANNGQDNEVDQGQYRETPVETQPESRPEDEGRYDEQKALTVGAAVLERDRQAAENPRSNSTESYTRRIAGIDDDIAAVQGGDYSKVVNNLDIDVVDPESGSTAELYRLQERGRFRDYEIKKGENALQQEQAQYADSLEKQRQEYDNYVAQREQQRREAVASGKYNEADAETRIPIPAFAEYFHTHTDGFGYRPTEGAVYPELDTHVYRQIGQLESQKGRNAEFRQKLSQIELEELQKLREKEREKMQKYLNRQSDYYAELYELNPDLFANMPTKEFMEHRDELAELEKTRAAQEQYEQGCSAVGNTLGEVLAEAGNPEVEGSVRPKQNGEGIEDGYQKWLDHRFLRNDFRVTSMLRIFHGYEYEVSDAFARNRDGYDSLMHEYVYSLTNGQPDFFTGQGYEAIPAEEKALWEKTEEYFNNYAKNRLDVTPRQLLEGFLKVVQGAEADSKTKAEEASSKIADFKQRFASKQEKQPENNPENS